MHARLLFTAILVLTLVPDPLWADWLHWRGPGQTGVAYDTGIPDEWSPSGKNVLWKASYGCRSTPLVSRGKVYIIGSVGEKIMEQEAVSCFDAESGKLLWQHRFNVFLADIVTNRVGWANLAGDPETGNIYAHGVQGLFFCFDENGKILWQKSMTEEFGRISGYGGRITSPIVVDDLVIFHMLNASWGDQGRGGHRFVAMDKKTGAIRWWSTPGGAPLDTIYSCAITLTVEGKKLLICGGADGFIHALKVSSGEKVWSFPITKRGVQVSPVADSKTGYVYICQSEENVESNVPDQPNVQGLVICLNARQVSDGKPAVVWKRTGLLVGYSSPLLHNGRLYVCDNGAKMYCLDATTGNTLWDFKYGRTAKGSPVWVDGKIFVCEVGARWVTLRPGDKKCEMINAARFTRPDGLVVECNGSAAVANGRVYLPTADELYCIGTQGKSAQRGSAAASALTAPTVEADAKSAEEHYAVFPADVTLSAGDRLQFKVVTWDRGRPREFAGPVTWSLPAMPPPPGSPAGGALIPPLKGEINSDGTLTLPEHVPAQSGVVEARFKWGEREIVSRARVRVAPNLPYEQDFSQIELNRIPTGWINLAGKFAVVEMPDKSKALKKLANNPNPLVARAFAYITRPETTEYTIQADLMGTEKPDGTGKALPDMGLVNCRYVLALDGNKQQAWLRSWEANRRIDQTKAFPWQAGVWYTFKLRVSQQGDKALVQAKIWPREQPEPSGWTLEFEDPCPNRNGAAALYAYATAIPADGKGVGTEIFFQNLRVVPNR
jgi:outer membrane protein assembly factor BamB